MNCLRYLKQVLMSKMSSLRLAKAVGYEVEIFVPIELKSVIDKFSIFFWVYWFPEFQPTNTLHVPNNSIFPFISIPHSFLHFIFISSWLDKNQDGLNTHTTYWDIGTIFNTPIIHRESCCVIHTKITFTKTKTLEKPGNKQEI